MSKKILVSLSHLDQMGALLFRNDVPVFLENNPDRNVGICRYHRNENGVLIGELEIENDVDEKRCIAVYIVPIH